MRADHRSAPAPLRRFLPAPGQRLTRACIRGAWWPSGAAGGGGMFVVTWLTARTRWWAALHDFALEDQRQLIAECAHHDRHRGYPGAWPDGRAEP